MPPCGGVRERIYESLFGSTLVWQKTEWIDSEASYPDKPERLVLIDPNAISEITEGPSESRLEIEFSAFEGGNHRYRTLKAKWDVLINRPDSQPIYAPSSSALRAAGETIRDGETYWWQLDCPNFEGPEPADATHVVLFYHEALAAASTRRDASRRVVESLRRATPNWEQCHGTGVIEVVSAGFDLITEPVTVTLELSNVDDKDAVLEIGRLRVVETSNQSGSLVRTEYGPDDPNATVTVPAEKNGDPNVTVSVKFTVSYPADVSHLIFKHDTRDIQLATYTRDETSMGRPRINPGG